ncbi:MAG: prefoldin subunit alpha [Candidatus Nanoarchaeia archaeon]
MSQQEKMLEYKMHMHQFQQLQQHLSSIEQHIEQLDNIKETLETISKEQAGTETLIPVGSGIFFKGTIGTTDKVIMNVGASVCVEKNVSDALTTVDKQKEEMQGLFAELSQQAEELSESLQHLQQHLKEE